MVSFDVESADVRLVFMTVVESPLTELGEGEALRRRFEQFSGPAAGALDGCDLGSRGEVLVSPGDVLPDGSVGVDELGLASASYLSLTGRTLTFCCHVDGSPSRAMGGDACGGCVWVGSVCGGTDGWNGCWRPFSADFPWI